MSIKTKKQNRSTATIDLGRERKEKIEVYRAKKFLKGERITSINDAVNILVDAGLEAEIINA